MNAQTRQLRSFGSHQSMRGNAMVETTIMMSFILLAMLGAIKLALVGYTQAQADGATYLAAHALARDASATASSVGTIVTGIFPNVKTTGSPALTMSTALNQLAYGQTYADYEPLLNLALLPGLSSIQIRSHAVEAQLPLAATIPGAINISIPLVTLKNYINTPITPFGALATYKFYVAQYTGSGNGSNGAFSEWKCHDAAYASLMKDLPATWTSGYTPPAKSKLVSDEQTIYGWDATTPGAGPSC